MIMKHCFKFLFVILLVPFMAFAQRNYKPAFVVTIKGDTLKGYIDYRGWDINPSSIRFQPLTDYKAQKLSVHDITYFELDKIGKYQRYSGFISMDNTNPAHMIEYRDTSFRYDTVFLEILQKGKNIALYRYSDAIKDRFFVGEAPAYLPIELGFRLYFDMRHANPIAGVSKTVNENTFMKQLYALAIKYNATYKGFEKDLEESSYREAYLVEIVKKINDAGNKKGQ
ncbi:MAG: hypothetical protein ACXVJP_13625 [Mucilaginibacter sp.]